jgi:hypothetical protein
MGQLRLGRLDAAIEVENLRHIQRFYLAHSSPEFLSQVVTELRLPRDGKKRSQAVSEWLASVPRPKTEGPDPLGPCSHTLRDR